MDGVLVSPEYTTLQNAFASHSPLVIYPKNHHVYKDCIEGCYVFDDANTLFHDSVNIILKDKDRDMLLNCIKMIYEELDIRELMDGIKKM